MGQQQLILLVLATIIVGIAIVVGIDAFTVNKTRANADALTQDLVRMASDAQAWKQTPAPFGGQDEQYDNDPDNFTDLNSLAQLGYTTSGSAGSEFTSNLNGDYAIITDGGATSVSISGQNCVEGNRVTVTITGLDDEDIDATTETGIDPANCTPGTVVAASP